MRKNILAHKLNKKIFFTVTYGMCAKSEMLYWLCQTLHNLLTMKQNIHDHGRWLSGVGVAADNFLVVRRIVWTNFLKFAGKLLMLQISPFKFSVAVGYL